MSTPLMATGSSAPAEMSSADSYLITLRWARARIGDLMRMCPPDPRGRQLYNELRNVTREIDRITNVPREG